MNMKIRGIQNRRSAFIAVALFLAAIASLLLAPMIGASSPSAAASSVQVPMALGAPAAPIAGLPVQGQSQTQPAVPAVPAAPIISATKRDALQVDVDGDMKFDPGDTIKYTVGITNTGSDATGVNYNDTLDPNTTLVAGSVNVSPLAFDDAFTTVGNTLLAVGVAAPPGTPAVQVAGDIRSNDVDFLGDPCCTIQSFSPTSANGGTVSVNANGSFTYLPPVGFTGTDTFTYVLVDSGGLTSSPGIVSITVNNRVWYVNNAAGVNGDGRSTSPFNTLTNVNGAGGVGDADGPNDYIYLHTGSGNYTGGLPLESGQILIGQGVALVVNTFTLNPAGSRPTITNSGGDAITLNTNNTIRGLNVLTGGVALFGIKSLASTVGNLTIDNLSISGAGQPVDITNGGALTVTIDSISTTSGNNRGVNLDGVTGTFTANGGSLAGITGSDFRVNGGTAVVIYAGTINNTSNDFVEITNRTGGSATFSGFITDTGTGITLTTNTGSTINFSGGMSLNTGTNGAFNATGGGTINVTGGNVITTTTGIALNVVNTTIGVNDLTFFSIASNGATSGIVLNNTGASGGLTVLGSGTANSGGTIQNSVDDGISLQSTRDVSLSRMNITNNNDNGLYGNNLTNFTRGNSSVTNNDAANVVVAAAGLRFDNLLGTCSITNTTISGTKGDNIPPDAEQRHFDGTYHHRLDDWTEPCRHGRQWNGYSDFRHGYHHRYRQRQQPRYREPGRRLPDDYRRRHKCHDHPPELDLPG